MAMAANVGIAIAKAIAGLASGSSAMLAEAAHSAADTLNEVMLLLSLSWADKRPDAEHQFGYGKERYFWAFLAATFMFLAGGAFSVVKGVHALVSGSAPNQGQSLAASYAVLAVAFVFEGVSLSRALWQARQRARAARQALFQFVRRSSDSTLKVILVEDGAAIAGVSIAATGLALYELTGDPFYDSAASIAVGLLLACVAVLLGADTKDLLLGRSVDPEQGRRIRRVLHDVDGVDRVIQVQSMILGPESLLVAARVELEPELDALEVEKVAAAAERELKRAFPELRHFYMDPTSSQEAARLPRHSGS